ncbi:hypothetical protein [Falsirhodobacter sp. 1013]|uniref:hypothetical protein n=1 Tax=Falsirhodobacter sp. 1013 TaxID=3417566 RepID=UPI003EC0BFC2
MSDRISCSELTCACGHGGYVATSRWQDEMLRRARCTVCGRRGAKDLDFHLPLGKQLAVFADVVVPVTGLLKDAGCHSKAGSIR